YVNSSIEKVHALRPTGGNPYDIPKLKETAKDVIAKYQTLSAEAKADLQKQFPQMTALLKKEKVKKVVKIIIYGEN
uniref:ABC transporter substrate-binding protein n=1 Tax=Steinernema glaseri TaxID=37863 RepID=A0A1I8AEF4_9BILA